MKDISKLFTKEAIESLEHGGRRRAAYSENEGYVSELGNELFGEGMFSCDPIVHGAQLITLLEESISGVNVLDVGCGSPLNHEFGEYHFLPLVAEALQSRGAEVVGIDRYDNPSALYDHRVVDIRQLNWISNLDIVDLIVCIDVMDDKNSGLHCRPGNVRRFLQTLKEVVSPRGAIFLGNVPSESLEGGFRNPSYFSDQGFTLMYAPEWDGSVYLTLDDCGG